MKWKHCEVKERGWLTHDESFSAANRRFVNVVLGPSGKRRSNAQGVSNSSTFQTCRIDCLRIPYYHLIRLKVEDNCNSIKETLAFTGSVVDYAYRVKTGSDFSLLINCGVYARKFHVFFSNISLHTMTPLHWAFLLSLFFSNALVLGFVGWERRERLIGICKESAEWVCGRAICASLIIIFLNNNFQFGWSHFYLCLHLRQRLGIRRRDLLPTWSDLFPLYLRYPLVSPLPP